MMYNEPDIEIRNKQGITEYKQLYSLLDEGLKAEGLRDKIKLIGPDDALSFQMV